MSDIQSLSRYNLTNLSNLFGMFIECVNNMGKNQDAVRTYKNRVNDYIQQRVISESEAKLLYKIVGMENTDIVKWDIAAQSMIEIKNTLDCIFKLCDSKKDIVVFMNKRDIKGKTYDIIKEIFDINNTRLGENDTEKELLKELQQLENDGYNIRVIISYMNNKGTQYASYLTKPTQIIKQQKHDSLIVLKHIANGNTWRVDKVIRDENNKAHPEIINISDTMRKQIQEIAIKVTNQVENR